MTAEGSRRVIVYEAVREALLKTDGANGMVLFRGERNDDRFTGEAYTFKVGCSPAPYRVAGRIEGGRRLVLLGRAPVFDKDSCTVVDHSAQSRMPAWCST